MTSPMQKVILCDTSCLILLDKIDQLHLLHGLFGDVIITSEVKNEFDKELPGFFKVQNPKDTNYNKILLTFLDKGEASILALALELGDCLVIMDELKGRREAKNLGVKITGTLGVFLLAKERNLIKELKPLMDQIEQTNFRINRSLVIRALEKANEKL